MTFEELKRKTVLLSNDEAAAVLGGMAELPQEGHPWDDLESTSEHPWSEDPYYSGHPWDDSTNPNYT
jgi:hypothetical protein